MLCPLKFSRYEFEGGEECIGAECGFFGSVCDMDMSVSVQKRPNELSEGDAVTILREADDGSLRLKAFAYDPHSLTKLADMVERDYVRRDDYDFMADALKYMKAERDEWKAKAESKSAKRAEVLERVEKLRGSNCDGYELLNAMFGEAPNDGTWKIDSDIDKLIDLLTDDDGVTNLEWLFENDYETLCDQMGGQPCSCCVVGCKEDLGSDEACAKALREWLMAPHEDVHSKAHSKTEPLLTEQSESLSDANDNFTPESVVTPETVDANDANATQDSREKLEADLKTHLYEFGGYCFSSREGHTDNVDTFFDDFVYLLDRQAAIVEREWQESNDRLIDTMRTTSEQYREKIAELTEQLEAAHAKNRALKTHISKMQNGRHGWHVKGVELQRQVDELTAQLHASNAERARLRGCLGIATDNAHDFLTLVDESGNVYDRDEGLA